MYRLLKTYFWIVFFVFSFNAVSMADENKKKEQENYELKTLTVTARKTEEDMQKIPQSITAFSEVMLEDADIRDTWDITRHVPNVFLRKNTTENAVSIRGVRSFDASLYSPTALYVDDVLVPLHYAHLIDLADVERVEVLRGPQGSLYGGNSLAGVINVITRLPDNEKRFRFSTGIGSFTGVDDNPLHYQTSAAVSGAIVPDLFYIGVSGQWEKSDGYHTNIFDGDDRAGEIDRKNGRIRLRTTPTGNLDITLSADFLDNDDGIGVYHFTGGPYRTDPYTVSYDTKMFQKEEGHSQNLRVEYTGKSMKLLSVTGLRYYENVNLQDYDATADPGNFLGATLQDTEDRFYSQEFRLSSLADSGPFRWLAGAYGFSEETIISQLNDPIMQDHETDIDTTGYAVFGDLTYTLFERLHLTAGLRYDIWEAKATKKDDGLGVLLDHEMDTDELLPKFSVAYDLTDTAMGYVTVSKGYLAGGYNWTLANDEASFPYGPEYTWNYEAGVKTRWMDNRLQANLALFYIDMTDKQVYEVLAGASPTFSVDNAAGARSYGLELEVHAQPAQGWQITAGLGYIHAEYDDWTSTEWNSDYTGLTINDYSGKKLPHVPEYTGSLGIQYRHHNGLFARTDAAFTGPMHIDHNNRFTEDAYTLVNLQIGYETERFDIVLFGKNVFNTQYHTYAVDWDGVKIVQDGEPALFGIRSTLRF